MAKPAPLASFLVGVGTAVALLSMGLGWVADRLLSGNVGDARGDQPRTQRVVAVLGCDDPDLRDHLVDRVL